MKHNAYGDEIVATELMLAGLKANLAATERWGLNAEFVAALEGYYRDILSLNNEQEALKSRLKEKTAALYAKTAELQRLRGKARRRIKLEMPQESWNEFGIAATR